MCERCRTTGPARLSSRGSRRKLWTVPPEYHCSLVGTCLSSEDIAWLCRRLGLVMATDARPYDVHRYFVERAGVDCPESRLMHKRLDENFAGALRRFARESTEEGWMALWEAAVASGSVAAAYWAVVSHTGIPDSVRVRAFADVHMLSHLMGGEARRQIRENQDLARRCADLEARLARNERVAAERLAEREARLAGKEARVRELESALAARSRPAAAEGAARGARRAERTERELASTRRRVSVERARARLAEAELERLRALFDRRAAGRAAAGTAAAGADAGPDANGGPDALPTDLAGQAILYVGGRLGVLPHIRATVEARNGQLLHHDGGMEQAARCLERLVERADVVVCPIDCVSHDACLRVKGLCRRLHKPFVPLRSTGASSFTRALGSLGRRSADA